MAKNFQYLYVPCIEYLTAPSKTVSSSSTSSNKRQLTTHSSEMAQMTKKIKTGPAGGSSSRFDQKHKVEAFVDKKSGRPGVKEEVSCKSSVKFNDKFTGCTNEYQTQVKCKKVTTFPAKRIKALTPTPSPSSAPKAKKKTVTYYY